MKWGLAQGMMGSRREALAPSLAAIGPNTYLGRADFLRMLAIAFAAHAIFFIIASLFPHEKVTNIPVRALTFKLGDQDRIAAYGAPVGARASAVAAPVMQASERIAARPAAAAAPRPQPAPVKPQKVTPTVTPAVPVVQRQQPAENPPPAIAPLPTVTPAPQAAPAIASQPQQYVREVGQADPGLAQLPPAANPGTAQGAIGGQGMESTQTEQTTEIIRQRYEQEISSWIERHKIYPAEAGGAQGRVIVRMRIDRMGAVRYYALEQSSGNAAIDAAAVDMVRRANPVPAVPANYPAGNLIEFLIPITFHAPQ